MLVFKNEEFKIRHALSVYVTPHPPPNSHVGTPNPNAMNPNSQLRDGALGK